jgi:hypothetical protein
MCDRRAALLCVFALATIACGGDDSSQADPWMIVLDEPKEDQSSSPDQPADMPDPTPDMPPAPDMTPPPPPDMDVPPPPPDMPPPPPTGRVDGEPCTRGSDCAGGTCISAADGWPDGYCTTTRCQSRDDCARGEDDSADNRCLRGRTADSSICVRMCEQQSDCREGYACSPLGNGQSICYPDPSIPIEELDRYPFDITCQDMNGQTATINYTIAPNTTSYMIVPFARDQATIQPRTITLPSGSVVNMRGSNSFQLVASQLFGWLAPTVMPAVSQFANQLERGAHAYSLATNSSSVCHYLLEESAPGTKLDINVYLVGIPNITTQNAANNPSFQSVYNTFNELYAPAGVSLGNIRYYTLSPADTQRFQILRSDADASAMVALSEIPGDTRDQVLSLNVFFVRSMGGPFARQGVLGLSLGLPGPAGLHGTQGSGVVFTSEYMGTTFRDPNDGSTVDGDEYTGIIFAHEVGHYLGLFHTIDAGGGRASYDPILDTPECPPSSFPSNCPDINNMMFPLAGISHRDVTPGQSWVIQVNPLTKN